MIEVFKTDVDCPTHARVLVDLIHEAFPHYRANFDLQDCDRILRVASTNEPVQAADLVRLLCSCGYHGEPLPDEVPEERELYSTELTLLGGFRALAPESPGHYRA